MAVRTITRRMNAAEEAFVSELTKIHSRHNFENLLTKILVESRESNTEVWNELVGKLFDMLRDCDIEFSEDVFSDPANYDADKEYIESLLDNVELENSDDVLRCLMGKVQNVIEAAPLPEAYLERIVDHALNGELNGDSLRLKILKRFIKYGRDALFDSDSISAEKPGAGYGGKGYIYKCAQKNAGADISIEKEDYDRIADYIDESVFNVLNDDEINRDNFRPGRTYGIIKVVNDLANGLFRSNESTKKDLYIFAIIFDMSFYYEDPLRAQIRDEYLDVETGLFDNYYQNNIKRFINEKYYDKDNDCLGSAYEIIPSGSGINYNNFVELTYIYYLSNTLAEEMTPEEKIRRSAAMIQRIRNADRNTHEVLNTAQSKSFFVDDILKKSITEDSYFDFVVKNIDIGEKDDNCGPMQYGVGSDTAFREYKSIINQYDQLKAEVKDQLNQMKIDDKYCEIIDHQGHYLDYFPEDRTPAFDCVIKILDRMLKEDYVQSKEKLTRTHMIAAYYEYFILKYSDDKSTLYDFKDVYDWFKNGINYHLRISGYTEINAKSLLDILIIASAYSYLAL